MRQYQPGEKLDIPNAPAQPWWMRFVTRCLPLVAVLAVVFSCLAPPASAQDAGPTATARSIGKLPYTISKPGTYILRSDLSFKPATGAAITVVADGVVIDLGGHILSSGAPNDDTNSTDGIKTDTGAGFLAIRNGTIKGFRRGIFAIGNRVLIERVTAWSSGLSGITVGGLDVEIRGCRVYDTGHVSSGVSTIITGIVASLAQNVLIADNEVISTNKGAGQTSTGITASALSGYSVLRNEVHNAASAIGSTGILLLDSGFFAVGNHVAFFTTGLNFSSQTGKYQDNLTHGCNTAFGSAANATNVSGNN